MRSLTPLFVGLAPLALVSSALSQSYNLGLQGGNPLGDDNLLGWSVAIDGGTAAGGAIGHIDGSIPGTGAVWVYERADTGHWSDLMRLYASDGDPGDLFGDSVGVSGDTIVVGASGDDDVASGAGAVYVFERQTDGLFAFDAKLLASDGGPSQEFGKSVSIDGDTIVVGAPDGVTSGVFSGTAYVFERQLDGSWLETAKLGQSDFGNNDDFGWSVSVSGARVVIGAPNEDPNVTPNAGSAYVFERQPDGTWPEVAKLFASDGDSLDLFGYAAAISGDHIACGAWLDEDGVGVHNGIGSAYVFERQPDGAWTEAAKLIDPFGAGGDHFGQSIAVEEGAVLVGAIHNNVNNQLDAGSAHLFLRAPDGTWVHDEEYFHPDPDKDDNFGHSVAISGGRIALGASNDDEFADNGGSVLIGFSYGAAGEAPPVLQGAGTPGCAGPVELDLGGPPILGNAGFGFVAEELDPLATNFLLLADSDNPVGSDPLGNGGIVYLDVAAPLLLVYNTPVDGDGVGVTDLPLPNVPALAGLELHAQALSLNLTCGVAAATSNLVSFELLDL